MEKVNIMDTGFITDREDDQLGIICRNNNINTLGDLFSLDSEKIFQGAESTKDYEKILYKVGLLKHLYLGDEMPRYYSWKQEKPLTANQRLNLGFYVCELDRFDDSCELSYVLSFRHINELGFTSEEILEMRDVLIKVINKADAFGESTNPKVADAFNMLDSLVSEDCSWIRKVRTYLNNYVKEFELRPFNELNFILETRSPEVIEELALEKYKECKDEVDRLESRLYELEDDEYVFVVRDGRRPVYEIEQCNQKKSKYENQIRELRETYKVVDRAWTIAKYLELERQGAYYRQFTGVEDFFKELENSSVIIEYNAGISKVK